jgi:hypothetical protein
MGAPRLLAQLNPGATTATVLYTVSTGVDVEITRLYVCNQAAGAGTFRVAVVRANETLGAKSYLYYDAAIAANATTVLENITLGAGDIISVYASSANQSFNLFGSENAIPI